MRSWWSVPPDVFIVGVIEKNIGGIATQNPEMLIVLYATKNMYQMPNQYI